MAARHQIEPAPSETSYLGDRNAEGSLVPGGVPLRSSTPLSDLHRVLHTERSPIVDGGNKEPLRLHDDHAQKRLWSGTHTLTTRESSSSLRVPGPSYGSFPQDPRPLGHKPSFPSLHPSNITHTPATRKGDVAGIKEPSGSSTYGQSLFNSIAVLVGVGILSEPLAFASAGWLLGTILIIFYGALSCYTAKILGRIILSDRSLQTYGDMGRKAFGPQANFIISFLFCLELFFVSCVFVTLAADSFHSMFPLVSSNTYKLIGLVILFPTMFIPLRLISYASAVGIISTVFLIFVVFFDGFSKTTSPGSLYDPAPTDLVILQPMKIGAAFGLFMSGFAGHSVIPSIAKDMAEPHLFDHMVNRAFFAATLLYGLIGAAGYMMFGRNVSDEISLDLLRTPGYNRVVNQIAIWMLVVSPLTKFPLTTRPLNITVETLLGLNEPVEEQAPNMQEVDNSVQATYSQAENGHYSDDEPLLNDGSNVDWKPPHVLLHIRRNRIRNGLRGVGKLIVAGLVVTVSIMIPQFSSLMSFLGAFSAFTICIIGPMLAKVALERRCGLVDGSILIVVIGMTIWGHVRILQ